MKVKEIRAKKKDALDKDVAQLRKELMSLRAQVSMGTTPKSTKQIKSIKKTLARINTIRRESADSASVDVAQPVQTELEKKPVKKDEKPVKE